MSRQTPEPWLRGTHENVPALARGVMHALELADEDLESWCGDFDEEQLNARPAALPPVAFHIKHMARSVDRLLTYAEGGTLSDGQLAELESEMEDTHSQAELFGELHSRFSEACDRITKLMAEDIEQPRSVGRNALPTTLGALLLHIAEHTQRHVGQAITTAKVVASQVRSAT